MKQIRIVALLGLILLASSGIVVASIPITDVSSVSSVTTENGLLSSSSSGNSIPESLDGQTVGVCVIGVPSPCNAPRYWSINPGAPIELTIPQIPNVVNTFPADWGITLY